MLKLFLVDSEQNRTVVPLLRSEITIGRGEGNTIRLTDQNISRVHARLVRTATGYALEDLSRYGVLGPSGPIVGQTPVRSGETYRIGDYVLEFKEERASLPLPTARPKPAVDASTQRVAAPETDSLAPSALAPEHAASPVKAEVVTPADTGTAVFLSGDIDAALSGLGADVQAAPTSVRPAPELPPAESGGATAGSIAVEPEPAFVTGNVVPLLPPPAPPATASSTPVFEEPNVVPAPVPSEAPKATMTLRPTSVQAMKLVGQTSPFAGAELHLTTPRLVLGSGAACDVVLEHAGIAPEHVAFRYDGSAWWVDALSGQVRLDGDLVPTSKLWRGAVVTVGGLDFRFAEPNERLSVRLAPLASDVARSETGEGANAFDEAILKRGKRNQAIGLAVGAALTAGVIGLLAMGGEEKSSTAVSEGSALAAAPAPSVQAGSPGSGAGAAGGSGQAAGSGSGDGSGAVVAADDRDAGANATVATAAQAAADAKAAAEAERAGQVAAAAQAEADRKAAADAERAARAAAAERAEAERKAAADAAKTAREAKAAEAAAARASSRGSTRPPARSVTPPRSTQPPASARATAPTKAAPPAPFQEITPPAAAEPQGPTATSLISDAKRAAVQNNRRDAVKFLEQARRLDPKNAEVNQLLFSNYRALGNTLRASEAVKRYLALKPNDPHRSDYEKWLEQNATP